MLLNIRQFIFLLVFALFGHSSAQSSPAEEGLWSAVASWPVLPIHSVVTSSGELLTFGAVPGGSATGVGGKDYDIWNPLSNSHNTVAQSSHDYFCSATVSMPGTGDILIAGGDDFVNGSTGNDQVSFYSASGETLVSGTSMHTPRWYPTATVLSNGEVLVVHQFNILGYKCFNLIRASSVVNRQSTGRVSLFLSDCHLKTSRFTVSISGSLLSKH